MKGNLENIIKQSLEGHEMPYNSNAWDSMKSKLDVKSAPVHKPNYSLYIAASALIAVAIGSFYYVTNNNVEVNTPKIEITETLTGTTQNNTNIVQPTKEDNLSTNTIEENSNSEESNNQAISFESNSTEGSSYSEESNNTSTEENNSSATEESNSTSTETQTSQEFNFNSPVITAGCVGSKMNITNENDFNLTVVYPNGQVWTGKKNSNTTLNPSVSGIYAVGFMDDNKFIEKESFIIDGKPFAEFSFDNTDEIYNEMGIPQTKVSTSAIGEKLTWNFDGVIANGRYAEAHFFNKGQHIVTLTVTDNNGCSNSTAKSVNIDENYNLMAVNSFVPTDVDPANNHFMPYSLTVRNTAFQLMIFDPTDGHLVYKTNDASTGWDGIDIQTGAMASYLTSYIWKVIIENPLQGESNEYAGTVIPLANRR